VRGHHLMERRDPVALPELGHSLANGLDVAGDVIAVVLRRVSMPEYFRQFPVFGVAAGHHDPD
jgi:hypothetical protein